MMLTQRIFSKRRHRTAAQRILALLLLPYLYLQLLQIKSISALYLAPQPQPQPQQQMPEFANNPALVQSLNQMVAQQVAGGVASGQLQVSASTGPNGVVSLASSGGSSVSGGGGGGGGNINNQTQVAVPQMAMAGGAGGSPSAQVAANAAANPAAQGNSNQFVIKWIHNDSKNGVAYVSITPVNHTNLHEPRIELRYTSKHPWVSIPESAANNTLVALVLVQDEDSGPNGETSLSIEHGNELGHFKLISTINSNTIQVNGAPLSRQRVADYNLTIVARDHGSPPKSSSTTLVIKLQPSPPSATHIPLNTADASLYNKPPVTDLMYVGTMLVLMFAAIVILIIFGCALLRPVQKPVSKHHNGAVSGGLHHNHNHNHNHNHHHPSLSGSMGGGGGGGSHKGLVAAPRTSSAANSRIIPAPTAGGPASNQCSAYCLTSSTGGGGGGPGCYNRTNL